MGVIRCVLPTYLLSLILFAMFSADVALAEATLIIGGNSYVKSSGPSTPDNKIHFIFDSTADSGGLQFVNLPSTLTNVKLRLTINTSVIATKQLYVSYFREDTARDDGDGPCTSTYVTYGDIADQCYESGESYTAPNWTCNQNDNNYLFFR